MASYHIAPEVALVLQANSHLGLFNEVGGVLRKEKSIALTGKDGAPIYCQYEMDDNDYRTITSTDASSSSKSIDDIWTVNFNVSDPCSIRNLRDLEIRVAGIGTCEPLHLGQHHGQLRYNDQGVPVVTADNRLAFTFLLGSPESALLQIDAIVGPVPLYVMDQIFDLKPGSNFQNNLCLVCAGMENISVHFLGLSFIPFGRGVVSELLEEVPTTNTGTSIPQPMAHQDSEDEEEEESFRNEEDSYNDEEGSYYDDDDTIGDDDEAERHQASQTNEYLSIGAQDGSNDAKEHEEVISYDSANLNRKTVDDILLSPDDKSASGKENKPPRKAERVVAVVLQPAASAGTTALSGSEVIEVNAANGGAAAAPVWFMERVCVQLKSSNDTAVIKEVTSDSTALVELDDKSTKTVRVGEVSMVPPKEHDMVLVIGGAEVGVEGELVCIDRPDAILKDSNEDFRIVDLICLVKIVSESESSSSNVAPDDNDANKSSETHAISQLPRSQSVLKERPAFFSQRLVGDNSSTNGSGRPTKKPKIANQGDDAFLL